MSDSDGTDDCDCTCDFCQGYRAALALHGNSGLYQRHQTQQLDEHETQKGKIQES